MCLLLWIPQLKEASTLLLMLGEKDEALFGHQVYAFSLRSCSFIKPMMEPAVPGNGKVAGLGCSGHSDPSPPEKSPLFPSSLLFPQGCLLADPLFMLGYRSGVGGWGKSFTAHIKSNKNCSQGDLLPGM